MPLIDRHRLTPIAVAECGVNRLLELQRLSAGLDVQTSPQSCGPGYKKGLHNRNRARLLGPLDQSRAILANQSRMLP